MTDRELMQQALNALSVAVKNGSSAWSKNANATAEAIRARLAQPEPETVAWVFEDDEDNGHKTFRQSPPTPEAVAYLAKLNRPTWVPLYTAQPQREWQGLTDEEILQTLDLVAYDTQAFDFAYRIETKLKEKNT